MVDKTANVKNVFKSIYRNNETMEKTTPSTLNTWKVCGPDPPENCQLNVKKFAKNLTFFQKIEKNCHFFQKVAIGIFGGKGQFLSIVLKKCQVFGNFLTFKWQFSGRSDGTLVQSQQ